MGVNSLASPDFGFNDASTLLSAIYTQATGTATITPTNLKDFVSVGQKTLSVGYDPLLQAISQVLSRTIFSIRPYGEKFSGLLATGGRWGNHVRKLKIADQDWEEDGRYYEAAADWWDDGDAADQWIIKKPKPLQLNFYGQNVFGDHMTIFADQLDVAFSDPGELMQFTSMLMENMSNRLAKARESMARAALTNFIGAKNILGTGHVIYLLDVYNALKGTSLTATTVRYAANWGDFSRWLAGYIMTLSDMMTEYTNLFQQNVTGYVINQHTPKSRQKLYMLAGDMNSMITEVLSTTYNEELSRIGDYEAVNFWQAATSPDEIKVTPTYMSTAGAVTVGAAQSMSNVLGVLFDEEAVMTQQVNERNLMTPLNARGAYSNYWVHASLRYLNDFTEKGIVLILDEANP